MNPGCVPLLAVVLDLFSRRRGSVSDRLRRSLALARLAEVHAICRRQAGMIHHSDSQYWATDHQAKLRQQRILV